MIDEGTWLIDRLIGAVMVGMGRYQLLELYKVTNDPRGAALQAQYEAAVASMESRASATESALSIAERDPVAVRQTILRVARDSTAPRGQRSEMMYALSLSACSNVHEFVFGPAEDVREALASLRRTWARTAADTALVDLAMPDRPAQGVSLEGLTRWDKTMVTIARFGGVAIGNPRFMGCAARLTTPDF